MNDKNLKMPEILNEILDTYANHYVNIPRRVILNMLIVKLAQMMCSKRLQFDESGKINIPNWISMIFMPSSYGKDFLAGDMDEFLLKDFKSWFKTQAKNYYMRRETETKNSSVESKIKKKTHFDKKER